MNIGDTLENSVWITGEETAPEVEIYKDRVTEAMDELCREFGFVHGPVTFSEKKPGGERVPEVPDHIQGQDVTLLIGEAEVTGMAPTRTKRCFVGDLEHRDLDRLRVLTRRAWTKHYPQGGTLTDAEVDDIIEDLGPEAAVDAVRQGVNAGRIH